MMVSEMALKDVKVGRGKESVLVDPSKLVIIPGWNEKEYTEEEVNEMEFLLETQGQRDDIRIASYKKDKVFQTKYGEFTLKAGEVVVIHGHRRGLAGKKIRERNPNFVLSAKVEDDSISEAKLVLSQVTDNNTVNLTPLQRGQVYRRSINLGNTFESISADTGQTIAAIKKDIALANTPGEIQDLIKEKKVSSTNVSRIMEAASSDKGALELIKVIADRGDDVFISAEAAIETLKENKGDTTATLAKLQEVAEVVKEKGLSRVGRKHLQEVNTSITTESEEDEEEDDQPPDPEPVEPGSFKEKIEKLKKPSWKILAEEFIVNSLARPVNEGILIDKEAWEEFKSHFPDLG